MKKPLVDTDQNRWRHLTDYLLGRNVLIGIASMMLLMISGYATWSGMQDFIVGVSTSPAGQSRDLPGGLSVSSNFLVIVVVIALTFLMWLTLRETFGLQRKWTNRLVSLPLYVFLFLWSIGFGYGFWWSLIAGEEATRSSMNVMQEDAANAGTTVAARLDAVRIQLDNVVSWSETQMAREEASGGSCGVPSGSGRGPLFAAREGVRNAVASLRDNITKSWINPVQADLELLRRSAARLTGETVAERQQAFEAQAADIRSRAHGIAARSNEIGRSTASEMRALADSVSVAPGETGFSCYDPTLAQRLRQASGQAEEPAVLKLREAAFNEGPAGVANAVKNLWSNIGRFVSTGFGLFAGEADNDRQPLTGRDLIALLATIGIDLGLFALAILNPPHGELSQEGLKEAHARIKVPTEQVARHISDAMKTATSRISADFEWVRMHFLHHRDASYFVIPNLYSVEAKDQEEAKRAVAMNQLAGVLSDLDVVRWPTKEELETLKKEEANTSSTDLTEIRKQHVKQFGVNPKNPERYEDRSAIRNHGLFSKAERMLEIAGWSEWARNDIEIFKLTDTDGLTPLLMVLHKADAEGPPIISAEALDPRGHSRQDAGQSKRAQNTIDPTAPRPLLGAGKPDAEGV